MIFPSDTILEFRSQVEDRLNAGEIDEAQAYREALAVDSSDPRALRNLALVAEDDEKWDEAADLAWRWLRADPLSHEVFLLIGRILARDPAQAPRARAYRALGQEKLHFNPEAEARYIAPAEYGSEPEPAAVTQEMEPHRLLHRLWAAGPDEVPRELVDAILARGADVSPLLLGVLKVYAEDLLDEVDDALLARALPLLGEIDTPDVGPVIRALMEFVALEDETISGIAQWGVQRAALRRPADVLAMLREAIPTAEAMQLGFLAQQIALMPAVEGRVEAVQAILGRLPDFDRPESGAIVLSTLFAADLMEGVGGRLAAAIEQRHGNLLDGTLKRERKNIQAALKDQGPYRAEEDVPIYDLVCQAFEPLDEEDDQPFVHPEPKLGRNDPCWCGSGKKYKKCHLAADESR